MIKAVYTNDSYYKYDELDFGKYYDVDFIHIHNSITYITLCDFPKEDYNSVAFTFYLGNEEYYILSSGEAGDQVIVDDTLIVHDYY